MVPEQYEDKFNFKRFGNNYCVKNYNYSYFETLQGTPFFQILQPLVMLLEQWQWSESTAADYSHPYHQVMDE